MNQVKLDNSPDTLATSTFSRRSVLRSVGILTLGAGLGLGAWCQRQASFGAFESKREKDRLPTRQFSDLVQELPQPGRDLKVPVAAPFRVEVAGLFLDQQSFMLPSGGCTWEQQFLFNLTKERTGKATTVRLVYSRMDVGFPDEDLKVGENAQFVLHIRRHYAFSWDKNGMLRMSLGGGSGVLLPSR